MLFASSIAQFQLPTLLSLKRIITHKVVINITKWCISNYFRTISFVFWENYWCVIGVLFFLGNFNSRRTRVSMMLSTINSLFISISFYEAKYNLGKVKTKPMQRCCLGYLGGSREVCRGIAMCFGLSCLSLAWVAMVTSLLLRRVLSPPLLPLRHLPSKILAWCFNFS